MAAEGVMTGEEKLYALMTTAATVIVVVLLLCMTSYCTRPPLRDIGAEQQASLDAQVKFRCISAGGSWVPVEAIKYTDGSNKVEMSCVSREALPQMVARMGKQAGPKD